MSTISQSNVNKPISTVAGEQHQSVLVSSQLATSTVDGKGATKSNLGTVIGDLGAAHNAHSGWLEAETLKVTEWGNREIERLMTQTKGVEERLIADAHAKQRVLEENHKADLTKLVQTLDSKKAMQLKELEDELQRQIQAALTTTKADISKIETDMNQRKIELMTQAQKQTAKDVDRLSTLAVEAKLVPSTTRTVIETNTETGTVIAVAGGGNIKTGAATASNISTANISAAPAPGVVTQKADVLTGDIRRNDNNLKVGEGAIVNTQTQVAQQPHLAQPLAGTNAAPLAGTNTAPLAGTNTAPIREPIRDSNIHTAPVATAGTKHIDASYGKPLDHTLAHDSHAKPLDSSYNKHDATTSDSHPHKKEGLLAKMKHAITGEPKTSDAHGNRV